ncbi:RNA polymerase sigma-70 factor, ECF subfamily [Cyclonatronum proteinivorum]|uniref:RNA polymerase sigma-70 factor, ECF subfamily n=1 Tax=Cyclonatronum proteinivorum TaxID=1457365 RepID=A0A345UIG8_9BACT|nr:RNA polymerase sigma-70 factor [Cyclonatronum proteinivorum]AXJ00270.1 RNA polymerase sigma-70 factor, ECF subfamily [Cyclonatronum proteinivorum]
MESLTNEQTCELFELISQSDQAAFDRLFRAFFKPLVMFSCGYVNDKSTASDIVQDTFVKLWQNRGSLSGIASARAYIYTTTRNLSLNYIRDHARFETGTELSETLAGDLTETNVSWNDAFSDESSEGVYEKMQLLYHWVSQLSERQREAFGLSRFEGLDHQEIASVMNVSPRTVNNHIVDALRNLQRMHEQHAQKFK